MEALGPSIKDERRMTSTSVGREGLCTALFVYVFNSVVMLCLHVHSKSLLFFVMFYLSTKNLYISVALAFALL